MNLEIHRSVEGKNVFLDLIGDLDMAGAPVLRQSIVQEVSQGNNFIILDFSGVNFMDSSGLGSIIGGLRRVRSNQGDLFFCLLYTSPSPRDGLLSRMPSSA